MSKVVFSSKILKMLIFERVFLLKNTKLSSHTSQCYRQSRLVIYALNVGMSGTKHPQNGPLIFRADPLN